MEFDYRVLMDENERQRMLADGYLPEVIDWQYQQKFEQMQADFRQKNWVLGRFYTATPYYEFVADVFPDLERFMVVTGETTYREMDADELMEYQAQRADVYVAPVSFIHGCYSAVCCKDIYAFVVDIDRIHPETLQVIIDNGNLGNMTPMPTYIVNSGSGVHFYYVFREPVPHYYRNQQILKTMYTRLCGITQKNILAKTDWHAITQPFRLPGSLTKLGQTVTGWKCGEKWAVSALAHRLGVDAAELDLQRRPLLSQQEYKAEKERRKALEEVAAASDQPRKRQKKKTPWVSSLAGNTGFYEFCLRRCYQKTPEGTRYRSMMALAVVARKVEYPVELLEQDLLELLVHYNGVGKHMSQGEVKKALRMYNEKALKTPSKTLEEWFGWEFDRLADKLRDRQKGKKPRKQLTRTEIIHRARLIQNVYDPDGEWRYRGGAPTKEQQIREWRQLHPDGTPRECMEATGISKNTVYKWWSSKGE